MNRADANDDAFAELLAEYDEGLAQDRPGLEARLAGDLALRQRLEEAKECLALLDSTWPRERSTGSMGKDAPPRTIGRFEIIRELGRGSQGIVFLALDPQLRRQVALKVPRPEALVAQSMTARFRREAAITASLNHPHLVPVYEIEETGPICYIVTAYCRGPNLAAWLRQCPALPSAQEIAQLLLPIVEATAYMHERGVLHRDIKPGNILLDRDESSERGWPQGVPKLTDFGLARFDAGATALTKSGVVVGTPGYMAPEQAGVGNAEVGPWTDVYALGAVLYECLTGHPPFQGSSDLDTLRLLLDKEPVPPATLRAGLPADLETICLKCLEKEPRCRYANAGALAEDLSAFLACKPIQARPASAVDKVRKWTRRHPTESVLGGIAALAVGCLIAWAIWYDLHLADHNRELQHALSRAASGERRLREENYAVQIRLAAALQDADPTGLLGEQLLTLQPELGEVDLRGFEWDFLWNVARRHLQFRGQPRDDRGVFTRDGKWIVFGGRDGLVSFFDPRTGRRANEWRVSDESIMELGMSPDGKWLATLSGTEKKAGELAIWDLSMRTLVARLKPPAGQLLHMALDSAFGRVAYLVRTPGTGGASAAPHMELGIWDWQHDHIDTLYQCDAKFSALTFTCHDETIAASATGSRKVLLLDASTGKQRRELTDAPDWVVRFVRPPGQEALLAYGTNGVVVSWQAPDWRPKRLNLPAKVYLRRLAFDPQGKILAHVSDPDDARGYKCAVTLWNWPDLTQRAETLRSDNAFHSIAWSPDGQSIDLCCADRHGHIWRPFDKPSQATLAVAGVKEAWDLAFAPDSNTLAVGYDDEAGGDRETLKLWDVRSERPVANLSGHTAMVGRTAFAASGRRLVSASDDREIKIWDTAQHTLLATLTGHSKAIRALAMAPNGRIAATAGSDGEIKIWDIEAGQPLRTLKVAVAVSDLCFTPDCLKLLSVDEGGNLVAWDVNTTERSWELKGAHPFFALALAPGGQTLAAADRDCVITLFDRTGVNAPRKLIGHQKIARALAYSRDGKTLASGDDDGQVRLWQASSGRELMVFDLPARVNKLAFSPDGQTLAAALHNGSVHIWRAAGREESAPATAR